MTYLTLRIPGSPLLSHQNILFPPTNPPTCCSFPKKNQDFFLAVGDGNTIYKKGTGILYQFVHFTCSFASVRQLRFFESLMVYDRQISRALTKRKKGLARTVNTEKKVYPQFQPLILEEQFNESF